MEATKERKGIMVAVRMKERNRTKRTTEKQNKKARIK
jgi:hypothetical protein